MTLSEFSLLVDAPPKWVLNARAIIGRAASYSVAMAERLAVVRVLNRDFAVPLPRAWDLAGESLASGVLDRPVRLAGTDGTAVIEVDVARFQAAISSRRSRFACMHAPRRAGRRPKRSGTAIRAAERYGLDVSLMGANLARLPIERLRQLDAMVAFRSKARRKVAR